MTPFRVVKRFKRRGEIQDLGIIVKMPEEMLVTLSGFIIPGICQARKIGGNVCGGSLREGLNGFWSCATCGVPAVPFKGRRK
jgi:hypothetical protein